MVLGSLGNIVMVLGGGCLSNAAAVLEVVLHRLAYIS